MKDSLGDRMKKYENIEAGRYLIPLLPVVARIDGRAFHSFTKGLERPFDPEFSRWMGATTIHLVQETGACLGYTQSDEITLAWHSLSTKSQMWFDGRIAKIVSQLAAQATLSFYRQVVECLPEYADRMPTFDARVWNVPNRTEGANVFLWREWDATKNSINMAASAYYSHKELENKNSSEKLDMLYDKGVNWNNYPVFFRRGTYVKTHVVEMPFTRNELDQLPEKHEARKNPSLIVKRSICDATIMPVFSKVSNREDVVFNHAEPLIFVESETDD